MKIGYENGIGYVLSDLGSDADPSKLAQRLTNVFVVSGGSRDLEFEPYGDTVVLPVKYYRDAMRMSGALGETVMNTCGLESISFETPDTSGWTFEGNGRSWQSFDAATGLSYTDYQSWCQGTGMSV